MKSLQEFSTLLVLNSFLSMFGKLVILGPIMGFPLIVVYSFLAVLFGTKSFWINLILSCFISLAVIGILSLNNGTQLILVGMMIQKAGIAAFLIATSYLVAKWRKK